MKRFLIPLLVAIAFPNAIEAGQYNSRYEASLACKNWVKDGGTYKRIDKNFGESIGKRRYCFEEVQTNQFIGSEVKKFKKNKTYKVDMLKLSSNERNYVIKKYFKY